MLRFEKRTYPVECDSEKVAEIQKATGLLWPVAKLLCERGIDNPRDAKRFLHPGPEQLHDPFLLPDMRESVQRIDKAIKDGEKMTVFCDYDADGICGGSALYLYLKDAGAHVRIMTPNRHKEGYGLNAPAVEQIASEGAALIITVDCGITNTLETALAKSLGIDVVITDHHECGACLPQTPYIINPKRADSVYPCPYLAGCGVAFKLIHALSSLECAMRYIDLVAIGTITDIVPMLDENRAIAALGISKIQRNPSAGIAALAQAAGISLDSISSFGLSFGLGPRINAAGRMDTAQAAIDLLSAVKPGYALKQNAARLCALNDQRKKEVEDILSSAEDMIRKNEYMKDAAIVLADENWNPGVVGIAAAKIAEKYFRPCVLFGGSEGSLVGSARSIDGVNMFEVLGAFAERYEKFGGHARAAGLTVEPSAVDALRRDVCEYLSRNYDESVFMRKKYYDMTLDTADITCKLVGDIERLEPFGQSNEKPLIAVLDADMAETRFVGKEGVSHLKFVMEKNGAGIEAISFFFRDAHSFTSRRCDFLCEAGINDYSARPQLVVRHMAMKYDDKLVKSFFAANSEVMIQRFLDETVSLCGNAGHAFVNESAFFETIQKELKASRFGLCIIADTHPALLRLIGMGVIEDALKAGELGFFDQRAYSADNCIACGTAAGHDRIYRIGVGESAFFDDKLKNAYRQHAKMYFTERDELLDIYRRVSQHTGRSPRTVGEIAHRLAISGEKLCFALRVFTELELIDVIKSGRIHAIKNGGPKKSLRQSECYRCFEDILGG
ncbi:MAG: single-stranded-DNA-specific exonuclease RecJ [Eubacteriales bacterium]|nr:single-stranded-DNA-specific exonuclease RecJ [Eubacteriales bacterium]